MTTTMDKTKLKMTSNLVKVSIFVEPKSEEHTSPETLDDVGKRFIRR